MKKTIWTPETTEKLTTLKAEGVPDAEIAESLGYKLRAVTAKLHALRKQGDGPKKQESEPKDVAFWRAEARRLTKELEKAEKLSTATDILVDEVRSLAPKSYSAAPFIGRGSHKKSHGSPQSAVLMFSDTHIGQVVGPEQTLGLGGYNFEIFLRRLARLEKSVLSILSDHTTTEVQEIVVAMLGDMIHGALIHSVEAGHVNTLFSQFYCAGHAIAQFFRNLSTIAPIRVQTVVGNHCVDSETELLTNSGWKRIEDVSGSEQCLGMDRTGQAKWQPFHVVKEAQVDSMVRIEDRMFDFRGTEHHRFYFHPAGCSGLFEGRWSDIAPLVQRDSIEIPAAAELPGNGEGVPDQLIELTATRAKDALPGWAKHMTQSQFDRFLMALINGDGTCSHSRSWTLYGKSKEWLDSVQALMLCYGYSGQVSAYYPDNNNSNTQYRLTIRKSSWLSVGAGARISYEESTGEPVWCVMTDTENFFCRRNGMAYLTGNTRWQNQHRMPTANRFSNLDQFLYAYVAALLADNSRIKIHLDKQPFSRFGVQGWNFLAGHGDHLRGGDKNLGIPNHAIGRNVQVHSQLAFRAGEPLPNYFLVGHLHRPITLPTTMGEFIVNGGFPGLDGFALMEAFNSAYPSQKMFLVHPKFGRSACYDLRLDRGDSQPHHYSLPSEFLCS